jgi:hypothetical protein
LQNLNKFRWNTRGESHAGNYHVGEYRGRPLDYWLTVDNKDLGDLGSGHAKYLKFYKMSSKNIRFLALNEHFGGQKESFKTILGPILSLFCYDYKWLS